ncbi:MAG: GHKL domain-containing protein [Defluviitaleaceae bacterium]|nr:GHKL domain-containing protein [Defluviitaleaceae bacterium]
MLDEIQLQNYLLVIPSVILFYMVFFNICKSKFTIIETLLSAFLTYMATVTLMIIFVNVFPRIGIDIAINGAISLGLLLFAYKKSKTLILSGYYAIFTSVTTMISGSLVGMLMTIIFNTRFEEARASLILYFISIVLTFTFCYFLSKYIGNLLHKHYIQLPHEMKQKFALYGLILSGLTFLISHVNLFVYQIVDDIVLISNINLILITCMFFVTIIMLMAYLSSKNKQLLAEYENKAQDALVSYTKNLEESYKQLRVFKHDHFDLLITLMTYNCIVKIKDHVKQVSYYANKELKLLDRSMDLLGNINDSALKGLLAMKFTLAHTDGIGVELDIPDPIYNIPISAMDLCRLVGIVIDNALEELRSHEGESKVLKFGIVNQDKDILIICSNNYKNLPVINKIFDEGYTTKESNQGIGLYSLRKICEECKNVLYSINVQKSR